LVPEPVTGEALTGYLDRVAAANGQTREQLYDRARVAPVLAASYALDSSEVHGLTSVLGLSRSELRGMTLAGYRAFPPVDVANVRSRGGHLLLELWPDAAAQCPACHAESPGVYPLRTINGIGFACAEHGLLHVDHCVRCGNSVRLASTRGGRVGGSRVPRPGCCEHSVGRGICGQPLADLPRIDLTEWPAALEAQSIIDAVCAVPSAARNAAPASIPVLAALARWLLHPSVDVRLTGVPGHLHELICANWRTRGAADAMFCIGRRPRTCVALVMSALAPGYLTGDAARLAADIRAVIPRPFPGEPWYEGLPRADAVVDAAIGLAFPPASV